MHKKASGALEFIFASFLSNIRQNLTFDLAYKSSCLLNEISSLGQLYLITFQFQVSKKESDIISVNLKNYRFPRAQQNNLKILKITVFLVLEGLRKVNRGTNVNGFSQNTCK